jgi:hypothetical protein
VPHPRPTTRSWEPTRSRSTTNRAPALDSRSGNRRSSPASSDVRRCRTAESRQQTGTTAAMDHRFPTPPSRPPADPRSTQAIYQAMVANTISRDPRALPFLTAVRRRRKLHHEGRKCFGRGRSSGLGPTRTRRMTCRELGLLAGRRRSLRRAVVPPDALLRPARQGRPEDLPRCRQIVVRGAGGIQGEPVRGPRAPTQHRRSAIASGAPGHHPHHAQAGLYRGRAQDGRCGSGADPEHTSP